MQVTQLRVGAEDGSHSAITVFSCAAASLAPVLICLPAMGVSARFYRPFAEELTRHGLNAVTADLRGHGLSSVRASRGCNYGYYEMVAFDWPAIVAEVRRFFPGHPLYLLGHSLGGQVSAMFIGANPGQVQGLILAASGTVYFRGWRFPMNLGVLFFTQLAMAMSTVTGFFPGRQMGFAGREGKNLIRDWARNARTGRFKPGGSQLDYEARMRTVSVPVMSIIFGGDRLAPEKSADHLCRKMPLAHHTRVHVDKSDSGDKPGHFNWVKNPGTTAAAIADWLQTTGD